MRARVGMPKPSEHQVQVTFLRWFELAFPGVLIIAIPNGAHLAGSREGRRIQMARLKAEGLVPGVPDLLVPAGVPAGAPAWIEMKRPKLGRVSPEQAAIHQYLRDIGHEVIVAYGIDDAIAQVSARRAA